MKLKVDLVDIVGCAGRLEAVYVGLFSEGSHPQHIRKLATRELNCIRQLDEFSTAALNNLILHSR